MRATSQLLHSPKACGQALAVFFVALMREAALSCWKEGLMYGVDNDDFSANDFEK